MARSVAQKLGVREGMRTLLVDPPDAVLDQLAWPDVEQEPRPDGTFDYIHLFATEQHRLDAVLPDLKRRLVGTGMLWVSWPKGRQRGTDLTIRDVIRIGYDHGLVESKTIAVDRTWSAIKFTHPIPGKQYRNRYGSLPGR